MREGLEKRGYSSVAGTGYKAPGVIVSYSPDNLMVSNLIKKGNFINLLFPAHYFQVFLPF